MCSELEEDVLVMPSPAEVTVWMGGGGGGVTHTKPHAFVFLSVGANRDKHELSGPQPRQHVTLQPCRKEPCTEKNMSMVLKEIYSFIHSFVTADNKQCVFGPA